MSTPGFEASETPGQANPRSVLWITAAGVLVLAAIAVVATFVVLGELEAARDSQRQAQQARETLAQTRRVLAALQDAETGERGFVITGSDEFLEPYRTAERSLEDKLGRLRELVADAESLALVTELSEAALAQLAFLSKAVELRRTSNVQAAIDLVSTGTGRQRMSRIRELVEVLEAREEAALGQRLRAFTTRSLRSERVASIALSAAIVLLLGAGVLLIRHTRRRLHAEGTARDALSLLRSTLENVTQGVAVFDSEERLVTWNTRYLELRGIDSSWLRVGMPLPEITRTATGVSALPDSRLDYTVVAGKRDLDVEILRADGAVLQVRGRPMKDGNYIVTYTDITALKLSETAYRDQATRLSAILDNVVDAIVTINESGSIESWSKGAERLFGYTTQDILRRNVRVLMPEPHASAHDGYLRHYLQTGEGRILGMRREVEALHREGHRIPVDLAVSEMWIGTRRLFIGVMRDISARQEIERLKSGFVSTVSHELRTPLTSISGSLGLLAGGVGGELPAKAARLIEIAKVNCERLVRLINDILDLEKAESGRLDFRLESLELRAILEQAIEQNRAYAHNFGATIELEPGGGDAWVLVDRDRLIQVLTNVLSNAAKFSPRGGTIRVQLRASEDSARVEVSDQGPGITAEFRQRIFQKFAQADSSDSRAKGGTGLGLSIARTIMERLGGSIGFESTSGPGATFYITLPVRHEPAAMPAQGERLPGERSVLICEDDPDVGRILVEFLEREGVRAQAVPSARAARAALEAMRFDAVLVDLHLPDADGLELIAELRGREATRSLPIIVLTARARTASDVEHVSALQLADWLQKPIDPRRLMEAIRLVMSRLGNRRAKILHVEDDESLTELVTELLAADAEVVAAHSLAQARTLINGGRYDLVILDLGLGDGSGLEVLPMLRSDGRTAPPVILYSATEPSREVSELVEAALVKSRNSVQELLAAVRALSGKED